MFSKKEYYTETLYTVTAVNVNKLTHYLERMRGATAGGHPATTVIDGNEADDGDVYDYMNNWTETWAFTDPVDAEKCLNQQIFEAAVWEEKSQKSFLKRRQTSAAADTATAIADYYDVTADTMTLTANPFFTDLRHGVLFKLNAIKKNIH